jgi:hypothetical protein
VTRARDLIWSKTEAEAIATDLLQFTVWQSLGLSTGEVAERMHITERLADRYERAIARLIADLRDDESEAAPVAPGAAPDPTKEIHS